MRKAHVIAIGFVVALTACSPKIVTKISKSYTPLDYKEEVKVYGINDEVPGQSEEMGTVKIGDTGFTTKCGYEIVVDDAKTEARKAGGNAIKIIEHKTPSAMGSSCHQITAKILKVANFNTSPIMSKADSILAKADYALLHIYRFGGMGSLIGYDLYLGDSIICRVKNNWKTTLKIKKDGLNSLWAKTESKDELPVDIKIGQEYYVRCGIGMGILVGRPTLEMVGKELGREEYFTIKSENSEISDKIFLNDGRVIDCTILNEDSENVYFMTVRNGKKIKTQISKSEVKNIQDEE